MTDLETEVAELRARLDDLTERVRLDVVARAFLDGDHAVREGDYFLLYDDTPTRLCNVSSEGKWTYFDGHNTVEPFRIPSPTEYPRLYTVAEVAEILARSRPRYPEYRGPSGSDVLAPGPDLSPQRMLDDAARALGWRTDFASGDSPITWDMVLDEIRKRVKR